MFKRIELVANLCIIALAITVVAVLAKKFLYPSPPRPVQIAAGSEFRLSGVDWSRAEHTIVLVLDTTCRVCAQVAPLYRRVLDGARANGVRTVAVFPQPLSQAQEFLKAGGLVVTDLRRSSVAALELPGTPAAVLVNKQGRVKALWIGRLSSDGEKRLLATLSDLKRTVSLP